MKLSSNKLALLSVIPGLVPWVSARVVQFQIDLTYEDHEVAGFVRKTILSNGQFPGPHLQLKQGDDVEFLVNNSMPMATTVHFHGIEQKGTPWSDGVPGLTQELIQPGEQYLYTWTATEYGTYIYHSHSRALLDDGLYGSIYIEPAESVERPFGLITDNADELQAMLDAEQNTRPILLSDWKHFDSTEILQLEQDSGVESLCTSAVLVNGKGSVFCPGQEHINAITTAVQKQILGNATLTDMGCLPPEALYGDTYDIDVSKLPAGYYEGCMASQGPTEVFSVGTGYQSFDLISMGGVTALVFSIDQHPMYVYAVDGRYVEPMLVDAITVPIGARYSVLVKLDQPAADYTVRIANSYSTQAINGTAVISYAKQDSSASNSLDPTPQPYITEGGGNATASTVFLNETNVVPFPVVAPAASADHTYIINVEPYNASYTWEMHNASYAASNEKLYPVLYNRSSIPAQYTVSTLNNTWVDLIINITTAGQPAHPIHKHSNKYHVIGSGQEPFTYSSVAEAMQYIPQNFNLETPPMRDTFFSPASATGPTWLALRYQVVNPGPFLMHCHLQMHQTGGMALALLDGIDAWPNTTEHRMPVKMRS
ncbi:multicopper oxidase [Aspergillus saccharolyticus JOP 1030-1]|uniref:Laccase n=1 Tax=Aspergillus saccharolyticus JOP 1030-1 TaxID=1450539 RepID=A0A319AG53_9EURO|nr:laccase [Aspergillus saccharolyticus JOP 1030-1]PYH45692.1 laccase [Aspergillus saccharolyticus JOP 1030-1]